MIKIYVCEDDDTQREKIRKIIENIVLMENIDMELSCVSENPHTILDKVKENSDVGLYFLDVDLKTDMNGLLLAQEIRKYDPRGFIVFVTTHSEMSYLTFKYKIEALDYILKDNPNEIGERIYECIVKANQRFSSKNNKAQPVFSLKVGEKIYTVNYEDILFFETSTNVHKIILHCRNRQMEFLGKIKEIEDELDDRFYRCHRSFLANRDNIKEIDFGNRVIYMDNGDECLLSSRMMKGLKKSQNS